MAPATPWHLAPATLAIIAGIEQRPNVELVRDLLAPSGDAKLCYVGDAVEALNACFVENAVGTVTVWPDDLLAALFGPADASRVFADDKARWAAIALEVAVALKPLQVAA